MADRSKLAGNLHDMFSEIRSPKIATPSEVCALSDNFVGIEHETENTGVTNRTRTIPSGWSVHVDDSLRNGGIEFVTTNPVLGKELVDCLYSIEKYLSKHKKELISSFRTSTHVHIDFSQPRDTMFVIQDFLIGYYLLEDAFFGFADPDRRYSGYCTAFRDADYEFLEILEATSVNELSQVLGRVNRYYACNPAALRTHGTIEFRHLPLMYEPVRLISWINMILRLKKYILERCTAKVSLLEAIEQGGFDAFVRFVLADNYASLRSYINDKDTDKKIDMLTAAYGDKRITRATVDVQQLRTNPIYDKIIKLEATKPAPSKKSKQATLTDMDMVVNELTSAPLSTGWDVAPTSAVVPNRFITPRAQARRVIPFPPTSQARDGMMLADYEIRAGFGNIERSRYPTTASRYAEMLGVDVFEVHQVMFPTGASMFGWYLNRLTTFHNEIMIPTSRAVPPEGEDE